MAVLKKSQSNKAVIKLKIPADKSLISLVRLVISAQLREKPIEDEIIDDIKLVVSELLAKAIEKSLVTGFLSLELFLNVKQVEITISGLKEIKLDNLFDSPYLNISAIETLVDSLNSTNNGLGFSIIITKKFGEQYGD